MIGFCLNALGCQFLGEGIGCFPARAIDDPALFRPRASEVEQLGKSGGFRFDSIDEIWAIEACDIATWISHGEMFDDVAADAFGGCSGKGNDWNGRKTCAQLAEVTIFRPEIVPPLANAMGLIDGELGNVPIQCSFEEAIEREPLRREIE